MEPRFIVAEISKNWPRGDWQEANLLCERFETVINANFERGYVLKEWKMSGVIVADQFLETIIAIFEKQTN